MLNAILNIKTMKYIFAINEEFSLVDTINHINGKYWYSIFELEFENVEQ